MALSGAVVVGETSLTMRPMKTTGGGWFAMNRVQWQAEGGGANSLWEGGWARARAKGVKNHSTRWEERVAAELRCGRSLW